MAMSRYRSDPEMLEYHRPSACSNFLHYTWKTITCLLSHVTLVSMVVSYCVLGAFTFEALEVKHEKEVKRNISQLRFSVMNSLWNITTQAPVLSENFTVDAKVILQQFEQSLLKAMTKDGWDGIEDDNKVQWTRTGALFYSIIVITTIGYGHISPKTPWGKIVTIFYAILGIPLMLLCLSNIGDIMATSFRFLYWRVCCYACTKKPKRRRGKSMARAANSEPRFSRSRNASFRRSMRTSTRSADSGFGLSEIGHYSHSDTELRYRDEARDNMPRGSSLPRLQRSSQNSRFSDNKIPPPPVRKSSMNNYQRGGSLDRRKFQKNFIPQESIELDPILLAKTPILCNRYVMGKNEVIGNNIPGITTRDMEGQGKASPFMTRRAKSAPRTNTNQNYLEPPRPPSPQPSHHGSQTLRNQQPKSKHRKTQPQHNPSPKMMTPLGYGHRSKYLDDPDSDDDDYYDDDDEYYEIVRARTKPVPIWLCVFLVVSYIIAGGFLFQNWEGWSFLNAAYFCFITLTTIGFGDLVPANGAGKDDQQVAVTIALCSLYLLFGIALLAMSFNLVQEEVIANVKSVAKSLGIIKKSDDSEDEE